MRAIAARVVPIAEKRLSGWIVGVLGGVGVFCTTMEVPHVFRYDTRYLAIGLALTVWNVGMLLARRPRPYAAVVRLASGILVAAGRRTTRAISVDDEVQATVARAPRGFAVAIGGGRMVGGGEDEPLLLEVETEADARAILGMLGVPWPGRGTIALKHRVEAYGAVQRFVAFAGAIGGFLYFAMVGVLRDSDWKPVGILGLAGLLSTVLWMLAPLFRWTSTVGAEAHAHEAWGALGRHLALHRLAWIDDDAVPEPAEARVRVFVRGDESTADWLGRLDAMETSGAGYRSAGGTREEALAIVGDGAAEPLARVGAARVLVKKHGVPIDEVVKRVAAAPARHAAGLAARVRVAAVGDPADAARAVDELLPDLEAPAPLLRAVRER